jgi:prepilin-type N-terminal cleavage/methylation domain-containing protein
MLFFYYRGCADVARGCSLCWRKRARAFTLVEILITLIVIGILAGAMMMAFGSQGSALGTKIAADLRTLGSASVIHKSLNGTWPGNREDLEVFIDGSIECSDRVCYDTALDEEAGFVGIEARLMNVGTGARKKLSKMATAMPFFSDIQMTSRYSGEDIVYYRVAYGGAAASGEWLFSSANASPGDYRFYTSGARKDWRIEGGTIVSPEGGGEARLAFGDESWTDYTITLTSILEKGKGFGVYYRATGDPEKITGYAFQYDPGYGKGEFIVRKVYDGREQGPIARISFSDAFPDGFDVYGKQHEIGITVVGSRHVVTVDGQAVLDFEDSSFRSGATGARVWSDSVATLDDITVTKVD